MLIDELKKAKQNGVAIGHFNFSDLAGLKAIAEAAKELNVPVIVGLSEGERSFVGLDEAVALIKAIQNEGQLIFLNADHTHSFEGAVAAASAGFDSIVYDRSLLPLDESIAETIKVMKEVKKINPNIVIEGEIGDIGSGSEVHEQMPQIGLSTVEEAERFVRETGVDVLAPAVGNMHGVLPSMLTGKEQKHLHIDLIKDIAEKTGMYLTLHGASKTGDDDLRAAIKAGITIVHINTEIRLAWRKGLDETLAKNPKEIAPYKVMQGADEEVKKVVKERLALFNQL